MHDVEKARGSLALSTRPHSARSWPAQHRPDSDPSGAHTQSVRIQRHKGLGAAPATCAEGAPPTVGAEPNAPARPGARTRTRTPRPQRGGQPAVGIPRPDGVPNERRPQPGGRRQPSSQHCDTGQRWRPNRPAAKRRTQPARAPVHAAPGRRALRWSTAGPASCAPRRGRSPESPGGATGAHAKGHPPLGSNNRLQPPARAPPDARRRHRGRAAPFASLGRHPKRRRRNLGNLVGPRPESVNNHTHGRLLCAHGARQRLAALSRRCAGCRLHRVIRLRRRAGRREDGLPIGKGRVAGHGQSLGVPCAPPATAPPCKPDATLAGVD